MADEKKFEWKDLLKYPVMGVSIVFCLWLAKVLTVFNVEDVSKFGVDGIEFRDKLVKQVTPLEDRINNLEVRVQTLLSGSSKADSASNSIALQKKLVVNAEDLQIASDNATELSEIKLSGSNTKVLEGWVWLGNYNNEKKEWSTLLLQGVDKSTPWQDIDPAGNYTLDGNMILRREDPSKKKDYFRSVPSLGIIPKGTQVTLMSKPVEVTREGAATLQYWAKVRWTK